LIPIVTLVELPPLASIGAFLAIVFAPFVDWAIMAFRPDFITGLMVAAVAAHLLFSDPSQQKPRRAFLLGCLGGACLLSKPTASPAVAGLLIVAAVLVVVGNAIASRQKSEAVKTHLAQGVLFSGLFLATSGLIFAIYLFFGWRELLSYIRTVMLDSPDIFALKLSLWDHIAYYLNLDALMLGYPGRPLALSAIVLIFAWLAGQKVNQISKIFLYVLFLGAAYILITLPSVKTFFFGGIFYAGSLVLLTICLCCLISFAVEKRQLAFVYLALPVIAILNIVNYTDAQPKRDISIIRISSLILDQVDDAIKHDLSLHSNRDGNRSNIRLLVVYPNPVADRDFLFRLLQAGHLAESLEGLYINKDLDYWNNLALSADYTVVPDDRIVGTFPIGGLPITALAPQVNEFMKTAAGAVLVKDVETPDGHVYVYRRAEAAPDLPAR